MNRRFTSLALVALAALAIAIPNSNSFLILLATRALAFAILVMSLDILLGFTGLASMGQAAYLGVGAYMTAILATFGAVFSYVGSSQQAAATDLKNDAILAKNQAIQLRTQAANQWSYYQSKSTKQNLAELAATLDQGERARITIDALAADGFLLPVDRPRLEKQAAERWAQLTAQ